MQVMLEIGVCICVSVLKGYKSSNMIEKEYFVAFKNITAIFVNSCPPTFLTYAQWYCAICFVKLQRFKFLMPFLVPVVNLCYCWFQLSLILGGRQGKAQVKPGLCFVEHNPWTTFSCNNKIHHEVLACSHRTESYTFCQTCLFSPIFNIA